MEIKEETIIQYHEGKEYSDENLALAVLLAAGHCFLNNAKVYGDEHTTCVYLNCSDMFMWACADAECIVSSDEAEESEIIQVYKYYRENKQWGPLKWIAIKRNVQPQRPVVDMIKKDGYWDEVWEALPKNPDNIKK